MSTTYYRHDGLKNSITQTLEPIPNTSILPKAVKLEMKPGAESFQLADSEIGTHLLNFCFVDYGDNSPIDREPSTDPHTFTWGTRVVEEPLNGDPVHDAAIIAAREAGTPITIEEPDRPEVHIVTLFFKTPGYNDPYFRIQESITGAELGFILSQTNSMLDPLPNWLTIPVTSTARTIVIDSEDFSAPNGFTENLDFLPIFNGSTFTNGPRIWSTLEYFSTFPSKDETIATYGYAPFGTPGVDCPNLIHIENQGQFSDRLNAVYRFDVWYKDEDGILHLDAYPTGTNSNPQVINSYIWLADSNVGPVHIEDDITFPQFGQERIEHCINSIYIENLLIGHRPLDSTPYQLFLPIGQDVKNASNLTYYVDGIQNMDIAMNNIGGGPLFRDPEVDPEGYNPEDYFTYDNFMVGKQILGIVLPENCSRAYNVFDWYTYHNNDLETGYVLSIREVENKIRNDLAFALYDRFGVHPEYQLTTVNGPTTLVDTDSWQSNHHYYPWQDTFSQPNEKCSFRYYDQATENFTSIPIPPMPETLEFYGSAYKDLFKDNILGPLYINLQPGDPLASLLYFENTVTIPKNSAALKTSIDYLSGTFQGVEARGETIDKTTKLHAIASYPEYHDYFRVGHTPPDDINGPGRGTTIGITMHLNVHDDGSPMPTWVGEYEGDGDLLDNIPTTEELTSSAQDQVLRNSITIETGELPNLQYAIRWQENCFKDAIIDPTSEDFGQLLVELPETTKTERAYQNALAIGHPGDGNFQVFRGDFLTAGEDNLTYEVLFMWMGTPKGNSSAWIAPMPTKLTYFNRLYNIEDIPIPNFILQNTSGKTYDAFNTVFNDNCYGEAKTFYDNHGVDTLEELPAVEYIGGSTGTLNHKDLGGVYSRVPSISINYRYSESRVSTGDVWYSAPEIVGGSIDYWRYQTHILYGPFLGTGSNIQLDPNFFFYYTKRDGYASYDVSGSNDPLITNSNNVWDPFLEGGLGELPVSTDYMPDVETRRWYWDGIPV